MSAPLKTKYRIERNEEYHLEDDSSHGWAVSYADFLMVLLSFFILFFSVNKEKKDSVIQAIIGATKVNQTNPEGGRTPQSGTTTFKNLQSKIKNLNIHAQDKEESLVLLFPDNIYKTGEIIPDKKTQAELKNILNALSPFIEHIDITFVGHTDSIPVAIKSQYLKNNFDLSVLRASSALTKALEMGLSPDHLSAKGSAENRRHSRTLSIVIKPKEK